MKFRRQAIVAIITLLLMSLVIYLAFQYAQDATSLWQILASVFIGSVGIAFVYFGGLAIVTRLNDDDLRTPNTVSKVREFQRARDSGRVTPPK
jgi:hypothetical protein